MSRVDELLSAMSEMHKLKLEDKQDETNLLLGQIAVCLVYIADVLEKKEKPNEI